MRLGSETGSLMNHLYASAAAVKPEVGQGATVLMWTDRHAATIVKVTPATVTVQVDKATRIDKNGMSESQEYSYEPDPEGRLITFRWTKSNQWKSSCGNRLLVGTRRSYHDFSF